MWGTETSGRAKGSSIDNLRSKVKNSILYQSIPGAPYRKPTAFSYQKKTQLLAHRHVKACLAAGVSFRSSIQMTLFVPFQNGEKVIFTAEAVAQRNGTVVTKQALRHYTHPFSINGNLHPSGHSPCQIVKIVRNW